MRLPEFALEAGWCAASQEHCPGRACGHVESPDASAARAAEVPPEWDVRGVLPCLGCKRPGEGRS